MKITRFEDKEAWLAFRVGKISGTTAGGLLSKRDLKPLKGYYQLIVDRIGIPATDENVMDRGIRLEVEALERFEKETGKKVDKSLIVVSRDDNENIAYSPDGIIGKTISLEVKCLNSASHLEAWITKKIPSEYEAQSIQPFVVNDSLKTLHFIFYEPRLPKIDYFCIDIHREEVKERVEAALATQRQVLEEVARYEVDLTF